jgi:hypothetical protein
MQVGILLLSQDDCYIDEQGNLPSRPDFDKELLVALCKGQKCLGSRNTLESLPRSIIESAYCYEIVTDYDVNLGIKTLYKQPPHLLIIVRSADTLNGGKKFDISNYKRYFSSVELELWIKEPHRD